MARSEKVTYWRGNHSTIPAEGIPGRILVEEDTGDCFVEFNWFNSATGFWEVKRQELTDTRKFNTSGGRFTGPVLLVSHPDEIEEEVINSGQPSEYLAATKYYVDSKETKLNDALHDHINDTAFHLSVTSGGQLERDYWNSKVDSIAGKGLSTNDFTNALKTKLDSIADNADSVEFTQVCTKGSELGRITIATKDGSKTYSIYAPTDISGNANTASKFQYSRLIDGLTFDGSSDISHYGVCKTESTNAVKQVNVANFNLTGGASIYVQFANADAASTSGTASNNAIYLKVNSLKQLPVYYRGNSLARNTLKAGVYHFVVDSNASRFNLVGELNEEAPEYSLSAATKTSLGGVKVGDNISVESDGTISLTYDNVTSAIGGDLSLTQFTSATEEKAGDAGLVPAPQAVAENDKFLRGTASWGYPDIISQNDVNNITNNIISLNSAFTAASSEYQLSLSADTCTLYANKTYSFQFPADSDSYSVLYFSVPSDMTFQSSDMGDLDALLRKYNPEAQVVTSYFKIQESETYVSFYPSIAYGAKNSCTLLSGTEYAIKATWGTTDDITSYFIFTPEQNMVFEPQEPNTNYIRIKQTDISDGTATGTWAAASEAGESRGSGTQYFDVLTVDTTLTPNTLIVNDDFNEIEIYRSDGELALTTLCRLISYDTSTVN